MLIDGDWVRSRGLCTSGRVSVLRTNSLSVEIIPGATVRLQAGLRILSTSVIHHSDLTTHASQNVQQLNDQGINFWTTAVTGGTC